MKTLKILAVMLTTLVLSSSVYAGEVGVSGSVKASISTAGSADTAGASNNDGKTLAISNDINFDASGELDNGWSWAWQTQLDAGAIDDTQLTISTDYGTFGLYGTEGGLNYKHGGSQMALGYGSQIGNSGGLVDPDDVGSFNNIQYHLPADILPFGITAKYAMTMSGTATGEPGDAPVNTTVNTERRGESLLVSANPYEGLNVGASYFTIDQVAGLNQSGQEEEQGAYFVSYKFNNVGVACSKALVAPASGSAQGGTVATYNLYETDSYSIGFAANDSLSISYGVEKSHRNLTTDATEYDLEIDTLQLAYTMGGMTSTFAIKSIENSEYTQNADIDEAHFVLSMAF